MARNLTSLIVDPNLDSRLDISRALQSVGIDCVGETVYGTEAVFMATQQRPTVILIALENPPVRGLATLESLQQQLPDTPIIAYSSDMDAALMRQAMRSGARDFLEKPVATQELRDSVHSVLAQEEQKQLARWSDAAEARARGSVITVAGAKGGIGKTTLSTNLAIAIRQATGQEVALVDGDAQFGDVAVMLDMDVEQSLADLARNEPEIDRDVMRRYLQRHESGINVLMAAAEPDDWRAVQAEHISAIARSLSETHEYVIIDTPGVMNETVAASLNEAAIVFLVTSLDVSSIKDTKTALRILQSWAMPAHRMRLVVNDNTRAAAITQEDVERACEMEAYVTIPYDSKVGVSVQTGVPVVKTDPKSRYARSVITLAEQVTGVSRREPVLATPFPLRRLSLFGRRAS